MLIDSHCHLDKKYAPQGPGEILERARHAGVGGFVCVGVGHNSRPMQHAVHLAEERDDVVAAIGLHPHEAKAHSEQLFEEVAALARHPKVIAVGEIGLDYHYDFSPREQQREVFRRYLQLALELNKPVVIHTREADDDTMAILQEERAQEVGGVFHCFSGDLALARRALDIGFHISFSGIVTFPRSEAVQEVARFVPSDRYLVETDAPYLAPAPFRGKKCEPAFVVHTARRVAELREVDESTVVEETTRTFIARFSPPEPFIRSVQQA